MRSSSCTAPLSWCETSIKAHSTSIRFWTQLHLYFFKFNIGNLKFCSCSESFFGGGEGDFFEIGCMFAIWQLKIRNKSASRLEPPGWNTRCTTRGAGLSALTSGRWIRAGFGFKLSHKKMLMWKILNLAMNYSSNYRESSFVRTWWVELSVLVFPLIPWWSVWEQKGLWTLTSHYLNTFNKYCRSNNWRLVPVRFLFVALFSV